MRTLIVTSALRYLSLASLLGLGGCGLFHKQVQEIQLPDGDNPTMIYSADGVLDDNTIVGLKVINFTGKRISDVSVNGEGGAGVDADPGSTNSGSAVSIPKPLRVPFYVSVKWEKYWREELGLDKNTQPITESFSVYKTRLVKVTRPIPPKPKTLLVILRPNDRVECEVLSGIFGEDPRIDELKKQEQVQ